MLAFRRLETVQSRGNPPAGRPLSMRGDITSVLGVASLATLFLPVWLDCVANVGRHRTISERTRDRFDRDEPPSETEFEPHPGADQEKPTHMASRVMALSIQTTESRASSNSCVVIRALAGATKR